MWSGVWSGLNLPTWGGQTGGQKSTTTSQVDNLVITKHHVMETFQK